MFKRHNNEFAIPELSLLDRRLREAAGIASPETEKSHPVPKRQMFAPRRVAVAGLVCGAVLAVAAVMYSPTGDRPGGGLGAAGEPVTLTPLSKHEAIALLAETAENGGLTFPRGDQFFHTRWERKLRSGVTAGVGTLDRPRTVKYEVLRTETEDRWTSFYREGAMLTDVSSIKYPTDHDRRLATKYKIEEHPGGGWGSNSPEFFYYLGSQSFSREELLDYRPSPNQLVEDLTRKPIVDFVGDASGIWSSLVEAMTTHPLPVHLRATAIEALGLIEPVKRCEARRDRAGRQGYCFAMEHDGIRDEMLVDPVTAQVLQLRMVVVSHDSAYPNAQIGEVVTDQLLTHYEIVDELPAEAKESPSFTGELPRAAIAQERRLAAEAHRRDQRAIAKR